VSGTTGTRKTRDIFLASKKPKYRGIFPKKTSMLKKLYHLYQL